MKLNRGIITMITMGTILVAGAAYDYANTVRINNGYYSGKSFHQIMEDFDFETIIHR
jgi:hypothetical protein